MLFNSYYGTGFGLMNTAGWLTPIFNYFFNNLFVYVFTNPDWLTTRHFLGNDFYGKTEIALQVESM